MTAFKLDAVRVGYRGRVVLNDVSLSIHPGERVALIGKSGAGKSSLLNYLYQQQRTQASLVPQDLGLVKRLSVFHNVYMGRLDRHPTWYNMINLAKPMRKEVESMLPMISRLGLEDKLHAPVEELSGGQQQRTAICRALHQGANIFIGDEPVSSVDKRQAEVVLESICETCRTVLVAMHDIRLAFDYTDRILGVLNGKLIVDEMTSNLQTSDLDFLFHDE